MKKALHALQDHTSGLHRTWCIVNLMRSVSNTTQEQPIYKSQVLPRLFLQLPPFFPSLPYIYILLFKNHHNTHATLLYLNINHLYLNLFRLSLRCQFYSSSYLIYLAVASSVTYSFFPLLVFLIVHCSYFRSVCTLGDVSSRFPGCTHYTTSHYTLH